MTNNDDGITTLDYGGPHDNFRDAARAMKAAALEHIDADSLDEVVLRLGWDTFERMACEYTEMEEERDRARRLAAKLEEVVAMRTAIVKALAERDPDVRPDQMIALQAWARAQLQEVP